MAGSQWNWFRPGYFTKTLVRFKGSIYKLILKDCLMFLTLYFVISMVYRFGLSEDSKRVFEAIVLRVDKKLEVIPITFALGVFVAYMMRRDDMASDAIPSLDNFAIYVNAAFKGEDKGSVKIKEQLVRYVNLIFALTLSTVSPKMKKRFPTIEHFVSTDLMTEKEKTIIEEIEKAYTQIYWVPFVWAAQLISKAKEKDLLNNETFESKMLDELNGIKRKCETLVKYDTEPSSLAHTQMVTWSVYGYAMSVAVGGQLLDPSQNIPGYEVDFYFPLFTLLQFLFYSGWLRVAETMVNSFGDDDDDIEINTLFDRNYAVTCHIATCMQYLPEDERSCVQYLPEDERSKRIFSIHKIPYTNASKRYEKKINPGSCAKMEFSKEELQFYEETSHTQDTDHHDPEQAQLERNFLETEYRSLYEQLDRQWAENTQL